MLEGIQDTLWVLDYYQGHQWALGHLRTETLREMRAAAGEATTTDAGAAAPVLGPP